MERFLTSVRPPYRRTHVPLGQFHSAKKIHGPGHWHGGRGCSCALLRHAISVLSACAGMPSADTSHVCGAVAGFVTELCLHPFDTVRARIQTSSTMYKGVGHALITMQCREGSRALYKGFPVVMVLSSPAHALYFGSYETAKEQLPALLPSVFGYDTATAAPPLHLSLTCGMLADMAGELLWTPCDVLKQRQQIQTCRQSHYRSALCGIRHIWATEGAGAFWKGYWLGIRMHPISSWPVVRACVANI